MTDERLLTAAKLYEQVAGDLDGDPRLQPHAGLPVPPDVSRSLSFVEAVLAEGSEEYDLPSSFGQTELGEIVDSTLRTDVAREAVVNEHATAMSYLVGVTEQDLDGSALRLPLRIVEQLENSDAPAFVTGTGNPNSGKTNLMSLLTELRDATVDDLLVISNSRSWSRTDLVVTGAHDLACSLIEHRDRPKFVFVDEGSTHFDARTNRREVAVQFTPLAKRFAKIGVDVFGTVGHTGKDLHPELKRLTTLAYYKLDKKTVDFFEEWPADADHPVGRLFSGSVENLEPSESEPDPNDAAPWRWDLRADVFSRDLDWPDLLDELRDLGPDLEN
ncbi:hypothetical protein [Haloprofundus salilacus]|uniref:hypothetical protein n=1 Tax=Haloprofundus salilacus TaxID=2876190 RepID=UPI001CCE6135|nr:hypothetical protein [Haloprofundus salilacus]